MILDRATGLKSVVPTDSSYGKSTRLFIKEMNVTARKLCLKSTNFTNPHGLSDKGNHSTAFELALLSNHLLKVPILKKIVNTIEHKTITYLP